MAHEITSTDNVLLVKQAAWHGLGVIVPDAVTPTEALPLIGAEWGVRQLALSATDPLTGKTIELKDRLLNVRDDNFEELGIVSRHYKTFTNREVAEFCESLVEVGNEVVPVKVETAGTIRGGKKVWFLLKGESFNIGLRDEVVPYVLVANGHDGLTSLTVTPTTIRVVCSNTLHMVVAGSDAHAAPQTAAISIGHMGDLQSKVAAARNALAHYKHSLNYTKHQMEKLADTTVGHQELLSFFTELYDNHITATLDKTHSDKVSSRRKERAGQSFLTFMDRFEQEETLAGASWWNAMNAYTGMLQHDRKLRGKDENDKVEKRVHMNLLGINTVRAHDALTLALQLAS